MKDKERQGEREKEVEQIKQTSERYNDLNDTESQ